MGNNSIDSQNMISNRINDSEHLFEKYLGSENLWKGIQQMCKKLTVIKNRGVFFQYLIETIRYSENFRL